jgi:trimeric autotransporter adhesin
MPERFPMKIIVAISLALAAVACGASGTSTSSPQVSAIGISPDPCAVGRTDTQQMSATATLTDGTKENIGSGGTWSSANTGTATVSANGVVVGVNAGITSINVAFEGATGSLDCTVSP